MKITTWNCAHKNRTKILPAVRSLGADFVLLQEVARPKEASPSELWIGNNPRQGLSVIASDGNKIRISPDYDEALRFALPVEVIGAFPFQLLAIWMLREPVHYVPNLVAILEYYRPFIERKSTVIAGDFNANPGFDRKHPRYPFSNIASKLEQLGLCSAYHSFTGEPMGQETKPTLYFLYHKHEPFHIDYMFIPRNWRPALNSISVGTFDEFGGLSDHRPLTAKFSDDLPY